MIFRSIGVVGYLAAFLLKTIPTRKKLYRLAETDPAQADRLSHEYIKKALIKIVKISGMKISVKGLENIPEEACLYVGNHSSYFDVILAELVLPKGAGFVAKDSLEKIPGLSNWMPLIHCLFLNRTDIKEGLKTINTGADYIKDGYSMFIFPEGTRSRTGELLEFKGGSLKMAQKARAPIVPIAISGTADIFENNKFLSVKPANVKITFGKPFLITDLSKEDKKRSAEYTRDLVIAMKEEQADDTWDGTSINF